MKIRTDFVTNSSSSGFVVVTVILKNEWKYEIYREYDTGWGGYFWGDKNRNNLEKEMKQLKDGNELLELLGKHIKLFDGFVLNAHDHGQSAKFRDGVSAIADFGDVLSVFIKERTSFEGGGQHETAKLHYINMSEKERKEKAAAWIEKYSEYIEKDPKIDFESSISFSGVFTYLHEGEPEHPVVEEIKKRGGHCTMSWVGRATDYLIVDPEFAGEPVVEYAIQLKQKGSGIKIVLLEDVEKILQSTHKSKVKFVIKEGVLKKVTGLTEFDKEIVVPDEVQKIDVDAFRDCSNIQRVILPNGLQQIGSCAFENCSELQSMTLPDGLQKLGDMVFYNCAKLQSVILPAGLKKIPKYTFCGCSELQNINLPNEVQKICEHAFRGCVSLQRIILPDGVREIEACAFDGSGLRSITLPNSLRKINNFAFRDCMSLQSITLPDGLKEIVGGMVFSGCVSLQDIILPAGFKKISEDIFTGYNGCLEIQNPKLDISDCKFDDIKLWLPHRQYSEILPKHKKAAVMGFARAYMSDRPEAEDVKIDYLKYIKTNRKKLYPDALKNDDLFNLIIQEKMIDTESLPELIAAADEAGDSAKSAALMEYKK